MNSLRENIEGLAREALLQRERADTAEAELQRQRARAEKLEKALRAAEAQLASGKPGHAQATIVAALAPEAT